MTIRKTLDGTLPPIDSANQIMEPQGGVGTASTDMGDVSWRVPTVQMMFTSTASKYKSS